MDIAAIKDAIDFHLMRGMLFASAALAGALFLVVSSRILVRFKSAAKRSGWPIVAIFIVCSSWATYTAFPTAEEKNRGRGNVANHLRQGYGGQDVQVLPITNTNYQLGNGEQGTGNWKLENGTGNIGNTGNIQQGNIGNTGNIQQGNTITLATLTQEDFARGFVLTRIGTNEVHDFTAPEGASICEDWKAFGAAEDWIYLRGTGNGEQGMGLRVHSDGWLKVFSPTSSVFVTKEYYPFKTSLGVVPKANWNLITNTVPYSPFPIPQSQFWHYFTPSNTLQLTWQNALYNRESDLPISFQAEFFENGDFIYRYDLSAIKSKIDSGVIPDNFPFNITIGPVPSSLFSLSQFPFPTTLIFRRLDPTDTPGSDQDGDGLIIEDELFLYHTDPYNSDTDYDGLYDGDEIYETNTDPGNPYSVDNDYYDSLAIRLGGLDPLSYPSGSTNTVLEHIFYTGFPDCDFSYPQSSYDFAVLKVSVSGFGTGRLAVGEKIVPLISSTRARDSSAARDLYLEVEKGVVSEIHLFKSENLNVQIDSEDLMIGEFNDSPFSRKWLLFPRIEQIIPCIHDFHSEGKELNLILGLEGTNLTARWSSDDDSLKVTNHPPASANVYGEFTKNNSNSISYTLDHPLRLNSSPTVHRQSFHFCPEFPEEGEEEGDSNGGAAEDDEETEIHCQCTNKSSCYCSGDWCSCLSPNCVCNGERDPLTDEGEEDYSQSYSNSFDGVYLENVLYLHRANTIPVYLEVPSGPIIMCCACPDHWKSNSVIKTYSSSRLSVEDGKGNDFSAAYKSCNVQIRGVSPSNTFADSPVHFTTNGMVYKEVNCTVLGLKISSADDNRPLKLYNDLSMSLGYPIEICTNIESAASLFLQTDVGLRDGYVKISLEGVTGEFQVWLKESGTDSSHYEMLLNSDTKQARFMPMEQWLSVLKRYGSGRKLPVKITSAAAGTCKLKFEYVNNDGYSYLYDFAEQRITSINPLLLADYNRDCAISYSDIGPFLDGRIFRYWINEDTVKGDYLGIDDNDEQNINDLVVNGRYDLVNFFPIALNFKRLRDAWSDDVKYIIRTDGVVGPAFNACFADLTWERAGAIQTTNVTTVSGIELSSAQLIPLDHNGIEIPYERLMQFAQNSGVMICEALKSGGTIQVEIRLEGNLLYSSTLPMRISSVRDMYRWMNLRYVVGDNGGETSKMSEPDNYPDGECDGKHFVFVHGYNVNATGARVWADQIFKRLWCAGSKSMFTAVDWRGDSSQFSLMFTGMKISPDYYVNVKNAFLTAPTFVQGCNSLPGRKVMLAHSLGNMLVSSAAKDHGLNYSKYYMLNAAVPIEAYDIESDEAAMIDTEWTNVPLQYRASDWSKLFPTNDFRSLLSWRGRFEGIANAVNCYSPTEDVLANAEVGQLTFSGGAWKIQEMTKGTTVWHEINLLPFLDLDVACEGGWGINTYYSLNPLWYMYQYGFTDKVQSDMTHKDAIMHPLFTPFRSESEAMHSTNLFTIADVSYLDSLRAKFLADAIPATSFAAGANHTGGGVLNYNMQADTPNGWPREDFEWLHSDLKDVSYFYVHKLFIYLLQGGLSNE